MVKRAKLVWHCRRGMRELDLLLETFLEREYDSLPHPEQEAFERLLAHPNEALMDWLLNGIDPPDPDMAHVVAHILDAGAAGIQRPR